MKKPRKLSTHIKFFLSLGIILYVLSNCDFRLPKATGIIGPPIIVSPVGGE
jgi:hypothetical protein